MMTSSWIAFMTIADSNNGYISNHIITSLLKIHIHLTLSIHVIFPFSRSSTLFTRSMKQRRTKRWGLITHWEKNPIKITVLAQYSCRIFIFLFILYCRIVKSTVISCRPMSFNGALVKNYSTKSKYYLTGWELLLCWDSNVGRFR